MADREALAALVRELVRENAAGAASAASPLMPTVAVGAGVATVTYRPDRAKEDKTGPVAKYDGGKIKILNQKSGRYVANESKNNTAKHVVAALSPQHRALYAEAVRYLSHGREELVKPTDPERSASHRSRSQSRKQEESAADYVKPYGRISEPAFSTAFRQNPEAVIAATEAAGHGVFANKLRQIEPYVVSKGEDQQNVAIIRTPNPRAKAGSGNTYIDRPVDVGTPSHLKALFDGHEVPIESRAAYKAAKDAAKNSTEEKGYEPHTAVPGAELRRAVVFGSPTSVKHAAADPNSERWQIAAWLAIHQGTQYEASAGNAVADFQRRVAEERGRSRRTTAAATIRGRSPSPVPTARRPLSPRSASPEPVPTARRPLPSRVTVRRPPQ